MQRPHTISVGIMAESKISFTLNSPYSLNKKSITGKGIATIKESKIRIAMGDGTLFTNEAFLFTSKEGNFSVEEVTIGVDFHWESKEKQTFQGNLKLIIEDQKVRLINILSIDDYLCSNISSEMSATSSIELLKAHTITSRSWLLAQILKSKSTESSQYNSWIETDAERIKWYDREDHHLFDVCADDHCQRYQGITRIISPLVKKAVDATRGLVLVYDNKICDARYYKCCGGHTERFETCWEPINHHYLQGSQDLNNEENLDLSNEVNAKQWILGNPPAFCNVQEKDILRQVLNDYDQETADFYRWKVNYSQDELSALIKQRSGIDFGKIITMTPLSRGTSGRVTRLQIEGSKRTFIIGKELEIRKVLSASHLYSSAFVVEYGSIIDGIPQRFILHGAGWGHGVGLCQIGAAVMADKGYDYKAILKHYFKGAQLNKY